MLNNINWFFLGIVFLLIFNNLIELLVIKKQKTKYKQINFIDYFKNDGYVKKVIFIYKNFDTPSVFRYTQEQTAELACIENEVFIVFNHGKEIKPDTYTLVQTDFKVPLNFKIIMESHSESELYDYIRENNLVEEKPEKVEPIPEFTGTYNDIVIEILKKLDRDNTTYHLVPLVSLLLENLHLSTGYNTLLNSKIKRSNLSDDEVAYHLEKELRYQLNRMLLTHYSENEVLTLGQVLRKSQRIKALMFY